MATGMNANGRVQQLDHFALPVMNSDRAENFYTEVLGGRVVTKESEVRTDSQGSWSVKKIFMKMGQNHVGLFTQRKAIIPKRDTVDSYPRCAFAVPGNEFEDIEEKIRRASSFVKGIEKRQTSGGCSLQQGVVFNDSEGNLLEVFKDEKGETTRVHHVHFDTLRLDESIRFYTGILNLELIDRTNGMAVLGIPSNQTLVLHQVSELSEVTKIAYNDRHFAFYVTDGDFKVIVDKLHRAGIEEGDDVGMEIRRPKGQLATYFRDPMNGIQLQLVNSDSAAFSKKHGLE